jgi:hypothetical protein
MSELNPKTDKTGAARLEVTLAVSSRLTYHEVAIIRIIQRQQSTEATGMSNLTDVGLSSTSLRQMELKAIKTFLVSSCMYFLYYFLLGFILKN